MWKKRIWILIGIICLSSIKINVWADELSEQEKNGTELLVLVDNSGSIPQNGQAGNELEWAEDIGVYTRGTNVTLKYFVFDDTDNDINKEISLESYKDKIIEGSDLKECIDILNMKVDYGGIYTDFEEAMKVAQTYFENKSSAENQYILIISDGDLDLNDDLEKKYSEGKLESDSGKRFKQTIEEFVKSQEQGGRGVVLTGLGEENDVCEIYENIEEGYKDRVLYFPINQNGEKQYNEVIRKILELMNIPLTDGRTGESVDSKIEFQVEKECSRVIVNIRSMEGFLEEASIEIKYKGKILSDDKWDKCALGYSVFIYLDHPDTGGTYTISLPEGNYVYEIEYQKSYVLDMVELSLMVEDGEDEEDGYKQVAGKETKEDENIIEGNFYLGMDLNVGEEINRQDYSVGYWIERVDNKNIDSLVRESENVAAEYKRCSVLDDTSSQIIMNQISNLEEGQYIIRLQVFSGGEAYFSNPVVVNIPESSDDHLDLVEEQIDREVKEAYLLEELTESLGEEEKRKMIIKPQIDGEGAVSEEGFVIGGWVDDSEYFEADEEKICFLEAGEYIAEVQNENGEVIKKIRFVISDKDECWLIEFIEFIKSFFNNR